MVKHDAKLDWGCVIKMSAATDIDAPRINCSRDENGKKHFQVIIDRSPTFNFDFSFSEVLIMNDFTNQDTEQVEIDHRSLSKVYRFNFKNVEEKQAFMLFYYYRPNRS